MKKSALIGKLLLLSLTITALCGCSDSDKNEKLEIIESQFYVLQQEVNGSTKFIPYVSVSTKKELSSISVTNGQVTLKGDVIALTTYETSISDDENKLDLSQVNGNYSITVRDNSGDVVSTGFNFTNHTDAQKLGTIDIDPESFTFMVIEEGSGTSKKEYDEFQVIFNSKVDNALKYGIIVIPEAQGDYYRIYGYRQALELSAISGGQWKLYYKTNKGAFLNRTGSGIESWLVGVYATDGKGLYVESEFKTLLKGKNAFE